MKILLYIMILLVFFSLNSRANEWRDVTHLDHVNFKMRVEVFQQPLVLEWGKIPDKTPSEEVAKKLKCVAIKNNISVLGLNIEEWKQNCSQNYLNRMKMDLDKFNRIKNMDVIGKYPGKKYENVLYIINYLINDHEYCLVVSHTGPTALNKFPEILADFDKKNGISASLLIRVDDSWKAHVAENISYRGILQFKNLNELLRIEREGFSINGVEFPYIYGFTASDELRKIVGRKEKD